MHTTSFKEEGISGVRIHVEKAGFSLFELSVRTNTPHTKESEALYLVYTEALLAGCGKYSKDAFIDQLTLLGSDIRITTTHDTIHFSLRSRNENLKKTLELFSLILKEPTFNTKEIARIKTHLKNNLTLLKEDARAQSHDNFVNTLVLKDDRRFTYEIDTTRSEVDKITRAHLVSLHKELSRCHWQYTCGGSEDTCAIVEKTLQNLKGKPSPQSVQKSIPSLKLKKTELKLVDIPQKQNIEFSIGGALPILSNDPEYPAFVFGISVLGIAGGFSGRLMSTVREKEGLTYGIYVHAEGVTSYEMGFWRVGTFFSQKDTVQGITSTLREIKKICTKGITDDELKRFKAILKTRSALTEDSLIKKVREAHSYSQAGFSLSDFDAFKASIQSLTKAKVNSTLKKYLNPKAITISGAGPISKVKKDIQKFANL